MSEPRTPVSDWLLERFVAGDLPPAEAGDLGARIAVTGAQERIAEIESSNRTILTAHPPAAVMAEVRRRVAAVEGDAISNRRRRKLPFAFSGLLLGATAGFALFFVLRTSPEPGGSMTGSTTVTDETIILKGLRPHLVIYKKTPSKPIPLDGASRVRAGDVLQVAYVSAGRRYGVVASVDGRGNITLHLPERQGQAPRLAERGAATLPHSFELDDSPGFERFVFVTADTPFSTSAVTEALRPEGTGLPRGLTATEIVLRKGSL